MYKKIACRGGHTEKATGSNGIINELTEDRKVKDSVEKYLKQLGAEVLDCTPPKNGNFNKYTDLSYGSSKANNWGADLFVSIHFNNCYKTYNGAIGTEVCVYSKFDTAQRVVDSIGKLGFINRGQKVRGSELHELRETNMQAMIIEVCFVEATEDVKLYKKIGYDTIGKAIAEAIMNKKISSPNTSTQSQNKPSTSKPKPSSELYRVRKSWTDAASQKGAYSDKNNAIAECKKHSGYKVFDSAGKEVYPNSASNSSNPPKKPNNVKQNTRSIQFLCNKVLGSKLDLDGIWGKNTEAQVKKLKLCGYPYVNRDCTRYVQEVLGLNEDGIFGRNTEKKIKEFQKKHGLSCDGIVGFNTYKALATK